MQEQKRLFVFSKLGLSRFLFDPGEVKIFSSGILLNDQVLEMKDVTKFAKYIIYIYVYI